MDGMQKGIISSIEETVDRNGDATAARVLPDMEEGGVTRPLAIPWWLRGVKGNLAPGVAVAFCVFADATGVILSRMDGEMGK